MLFSFLLTSLKMRTVHKAKSILFYCWFYNLYKCNYMTITAQVREKWSYIGTELLYFIEIRSVLTLSRLWHYNLYIITPRLIYKKKTSKVSLQKRE